MPVASPSIQEAAPTLALDVEGLYRRYGPMVLRRCHRLLGRMDEAEDAMQDVFVAALERADDLHGTYPSSLLWRMATNHCLNRIRARRVRREESGDDVLHSIAALDDNEFENRNILDRLFGRTAESTRVMAVLHWVDGMTHEEVARETGLSVSGVRKRLRTLREKVRDLEEIP
jgi:RNA polymerase sigma-70 factor (ECF subfamily)